MKNGLIKWLIGSIIIVAGGMLCEMLFRHSWIRFYIIYYGNIAWAVCLFYINDSLKKKKEEITKEGGCADPE